MPAGELFFFDDMLPDVRELAAQIDQQVQQFIATLVLQYLPELHLRLCISWRGVVYRAVILPLVI